MKNSMGSSNRNLCSAQDQKWAGTQANLIVTVYTIQCQYIMQFELHLPDTEKEKTGKQLHHFHT